ncbi:MAG: hypothetical protein AAF411_17650 [Myxococcota bacterium]
MRPASTSASLHGTPRSADEAVQPLWPAKSITAQKVKFLLLIVISKETNIELTLETEVRHTPHM